MKNNKENVIRLLKAMSGLKTKKGLAKSLSGDLRSFRRHLRRDKHFLEIITNLLEDKNFYEKWVTSVLWTPESHALRKEIVAENSQENVIRFLRHTAERARGFAKFGLSEHIRRVCMLEAFADDFVASLLEDQDYFNEYAKIYLKVI